MTTRHLRLTLARKLIQTAENILMLPAADSRHVDLQLSERAGTLAEMIAHEQTVHRTIYVSAFIMDGVPSTT